MPEGEILHKILGIIGGTFLSLVFIPPHTRLGFARRLTAGLLFGFLFGHIVLAYMLRYMGAEPSFEHTMAGFALASFISWWGMGAVTRFARKRAADDSDTEKS